MKRVLLYSPAIVLAAWTVIVILWGFDSLAVNVIMMAALTLSVIAAQFTRDRMYERLMDRRNGRHNGRGQAAH